MDSKNQQQQLQQSSDSIQSNIIPGMTGMESSWDKSHSFREGSDSGVETGLMRELSNNSSNDYASSSYHATDDNGTTTTSCTSSMVSCSSDFPPEDTVKAAECASEGGSESSSVPLMEMFDKMPTPVSTLTRKRLNFKDNDRRHTITSGPNLLTLERARSREKTKPTVIEKETPTRVATLTRTVSMSRSIARTPGCVTNSPSSVDDGRWPSTGSRATRASSVVPSSISTLPRRRRGVEEDLKQISRSSSISRDNSMSLSMSGRLPKPSTFRAKPMQKTKIYHENAVQTALTGEDLEKAMTSGIKVDVNVEHTIVEKHTKETQSDIRDKEFERLELRLKEALQECDAKTKLISHLEQELTKEREEKKVLQKDTQEHSVKLVSLLEPYLATSVSSQSGDEQMSHHDSLVALEMQLKSNEKIFRRQQEEIKRLQNTCCALHQDLERSMVTQQNLVKQKRELEEESSELHEFLQAEKLAFVDALKESENDVAAIQNDLKQKTADLEKQQEEVRHLVRVNEQRRQEYLGMQAKYLALENRSKDLLCQQGTAVSDASCALADLCQRLDNLVDQLVKSYDLTELELGDIYACDDLKTTLEGHISPSVSPTQQRNQSFLTAVVNAIKSAATSAKQSVTQKRDSKDTEEQSDSTEMLDSETEPCLMMENVLEDVTIPDSHSQNLVSTSQIMLSHIEMPPEMYRQDDSFNNLSEAIANRQQLELQVKLDDLSPTSNESLLDQPSISDFCTAHALVDQVREIDILVTKLLKVLHIVQVNSDCWIQELLIEKEKLENSSLNDTNQDALKGLEEENSDLKSEMKEASMQLLQKSTELVNCKFDLQRHRLEIDKLNQDICNLSTLCSFQKMSLKESGKKGSENENDPTSLIPEETPGWKQAMLEAKRQYDAIDHALDTLQNIQPIVEQYPALKTLQEKLEETNFHAATSLPLLNAVLVASVNNGNGKNCSNSDLNANPNGSENNNGNNNNNNNNGMTIQLCSSDATTGTGNQAIDSTA